MQRWDAGMEKWLEMQGCFSRPRCYLNKQRREAYTSGHFDTNSLVLSILILWSCTCKFQKGWEYIAEKEFHKMLKSWVGFCRSLAVRIEVWEEQINWDVRREWEILQWTLGLQCILWILSFSGKIKYVSVGSLVTLGRVMFHLRLNIDCIRSLYRRHFLTRDWLRWWAMLRPHRAAVQLIRCDSRTLHWFVCSSLSYCVSVASCRRSVRCCALKTLRAVM